MPDEEQQITTYVYNGVEVKMTGRRAKKETRRNEIMLVEITPYNVEDGTWKRWVNPTELYEIIQ